MSMEARNSILGKIRAANGGAAALAEAQTAWPLLEREFVSGSSLTRSEVLTLFVERLEDYDTVVQRCSPQLVAETLAEMIRASRVKSLGVPDGITTPAVVGVDVVEAEGLGHEALNRVEAILTEATVGVAETGSIVLQAVLGQGRRALSLVPDVHFCIVQAADVVATVPEAMARLESKNTLPTTFISGPSATADIEMTRIRGVHGPRFLHVLLVE